jgi:hypothetical protein
VTDPVSWLQIEKGWNVVSADGVLVGKVVAVTSDEHDDIFDGLAVKSKQSAHVRYVPGEQVAAIFPGEVTAEDRGCGNGHARTLQRAGAVAHGAPVHQSGCHSQHTFVSARADSTTTSWAGPKSNSVFCAGHGRFIVSYRRQPKFRQQRRDLSFVRVQQC